MYENVISRTRKKYIDILIANEMSENKIFGRRQNARQDYLYKKGKKIKGSVQVSIGLMMANNV